jgi:hypothetical protein
VITAVVLTGLTLLAILLLLMAFSRGLRDWISGGPERRKKAAIEVEKDYLEKLLTLQRPECERDRAFLKACNFDVDEVILATRRRIARMEGQTDVQIRRTESLMRRVGSSVPPPREFLESNLRGVPKPPVHYLAASNTLVDADGVMWRHEDIDRAAKRARQLDLTSYLDV